MAGRGPAPKDATKRARRNATPAETQLVDDAVVKAPKLPGSRKFLAATREWYETWCSSPQAQQFIATDWLRLHMTAKLVDAFHRSESPLEAKQLMSEIRLNEQKLGGTPEDRLRLRWRLADAKDEEEKGGQAGTPAVARRRRGDPRLKLVAGGGGA